MGLESSSRVLWRGLSRGLSTCFGEAGGSLGEAGLREYTSADPQVFRLHERVPDQLFEDGEQKSECLLGIGPSLDACWSACWYMMAGDGGSQH